MAVFRWQYPTKVEPFEAALYDPAQLQWLFRPIDQLLPLPSSIVVPDPIVIDLSVYPQNLDWLQPTNQPVSEVQHPVGFDVPFTVEPGLQLAVNLDWLQPASEPFLEVQHPTGFDVPFVVEPTLHVVQNLDWLQQTNQPIFESPFPTIVFVPGQFEPADFAVITWTTITEPFSIFLYTAANWPTMGWYLEVVMRATSGTAHARLWDLTDSAVVASSEIATASGTFVRVRTTAVTLTDGHEYQTQFGTVAGDTGEAHGAKLIGI